MFGIYFIILSWVCLQGAVGYKHVWGNEMPVLLMNKFLDKLWLVVHLNVYPMIYHLISQLAILQESKPFLWDPSAPHPSERIFLGAVLNQGLCTFGW